MAKDCTKGAPDGSGPILGEARPIAILGFHLGWENRFLHLLTQTDRKAVNHERV